ncbi:MAG: lysine 2,3-aminomutase [Rhodothermales bacterium]|jgi:lysine 2,3-aminomutase
MTRPDHVSETDWADWKWHMRNRVSSPEALADWIHPTDDELSGIEETKGIFRWNITPYYASLMDPTDASCAVRRQVVPLAVECEPDLVGVVDPLEEVAHSPVKNLIHNYPDRVAFCVTSECAIYCRYCLRKRMVGDSDAMMRKNEVDEAVDYIAGHPEIRDVLLTGGDPLTFGDKGIERIVSALRAIPHVKIIRIGSRMPVKLPQRITPELVDMLSQYHPIWVNTHFNHPKELTADADAALGRLLGGGIPVGNQTVLLRGINDNLDTLRDLFNGLVHMRARPYYLYQAQLIGGTRHLRTSIEHGMQLMERLQGTMTGFGIPAYVLDTPYGKVPLTRSWVLGRCGDHVVMRTTRGTVWAEPNPRPPGDPSEPLPEIPMPAGAETIPTGAAKFGEEQRWVVPAL